MQTCHISKINSNFYPSISLLLQSLKHGSTISRDLYSLTEYSFVEQHRSNKCGGGVGIFLRNHLNYSKRNDLNVFNESCESLFVEIDRTKLIKEKNIIIGVIYRPPNTEISYFIETMKDIMEKIKK